MFVGCQGPPGIQGLPWPPGLSKGYLERPGNKDDTGPRGPEGKPGSNCADSCQNYILHLLNGKNMSVNSSIFKCPVLNLQAVPVLIDFLF